jgi:hypothetical protein
MSLTKPLLAAGIVLLASTFAGTPARADTKQVCVAASSDGQALRDAAKLQEARDRFLACARDACPSIVRKYCAEWLTDVERRIPSAVFRIQTADGADVLGARLTLDGQAQPHGLEGSAIPLDPGEHALRVERDGAEPFEEHVVIVEGEKGRVVTIRLPGPPHRESPPPAVPAAETPTPTHAIAITPLALVFAGVGAVGLAGFTYFGLTAQGDLNHLRQTCAPTCASSDLDAVKREALAADVSLGVGVVALGVAVYAVLSHRSAPATTALLGVTPVPGGGVAAVGGRF